MRLRLLVLLLCEVYLLLIICLYFHLVILYYYRNIPTLFVVLPLYHLTSQL